MNLGTLLATGKSIMKGQVKISYRASRQVYLPKFGPVKNPFKPETAPPSAETGHAAPVARRSAHAAPEPLVPATGNHFTSPAQPVPTPPAAAEKRAHWTGKFNPAQIFRHATAQNAANPPGEAAKAQKTAATQAELSLDSVKVVHNDLSDVDVEVVPMKSRSGGAELQEPKKPWEFLGERLLGIEAS